MERVGLYPGTFDPITNGHLDVIGRAVKLVDKLIIGVAVNETKRPLFSLDERVAMVLEETESLTGEAIIEARPFSSLLMHFAVECNASIIIRGLRSSSDFEYEFQMAVMNEKMDDATERVFFMASPENQAISSRLVKEIASLGGKADLFVPSGVYSRLKNKYSQKGE